MKKLLLIIIFVLISNTIIAKNIELSFWFSGRFNAKEWIEEMVDEYNNLYIGHKDHQGLTLFKDIKKDHQKLTLGVCPHWGV